MILTFFAIVMGSLSFCATQNSSIARYRSKTWPEAVSWRIELEHFGLKQRHNLGDYSHLFAHHPDAFNEEQVIWVSLDGCIVQLPSSPYEAHTAELWTCDGKLFAPARWARVGSGIEAFEKLIRFLEKNPKKLVVTPFSKRYIVDPKEIRY